MRMWEGERDERLGIEGEGEREMSLKYIVLSFEGVSNGRNEYGDGWLLKK